MRPPTPEGLLWISDEWVPSGCCGCSVTFTVGLEVVSGDPIQDLQFDLLYLYDFPVLEYREGDYTLGSLISDWPVHDDYAVSPGLLRFGALHWADSIPLGTKGDLVHFRFKTVCAGNWTKRRFPMRLVNLEGGISDYDVRNGFFLFGIAPRSYLPAVLKSR